MSELVPLFPLPGVVLLPRVVLPLHVFEERYKALTADALSGDGRLAIALLREGWEQNYHGSPAIEPVVGVGEILQHERLSDGRYNLLLQGKERVRVVREERVGLYRAAEVEPLEGPTVLEIDLMDYRRRLGALLTGPLSKLPLATQFAELLKTVVSTADATDVIAFHLVEDVREKQLFLEESDARERAKRLLELLGRMVKPGAGGGEHLGRGLGVN